MGTASPKPERQRSPLPSSCVPEGRRMHVVHPPGAAMAAGLIAGPDMDAHFPGNTPRRTGEAHQTGREYPERQRPLALMQQGISEVVEGARVALAPGASAAGAVVV